MPVSLLFRQSALPIWPRFESHVSISISYYEGFSWADLEGSRLGLQGVERKKIQGWVWWICKKFGCLQLTPLLNSTSGFLWGNQLPSLCSLRGIPRTSLHRSLRTRPYPPALISQSEPASPRIRTQTITLGMVWVEKGGFIRKVTP